MNPQRHEQTRPRSRGGNHHRNDAQEVLLEINEDAERLKNRYPKETVVTGGGE